MESGFKSRLTALISTTCLMLVLGDLSSIAHAQQESPWSRIYNSLFGSKPPVPSGTAGSRAHPEGLWSRIYNSSFGGQPPVPSGTGGSRGDQLLCSVIPGQWGTEKPLMLRSRPTWVWRGQVKFVQLKESGKVIWEQPVQLTPDADGLTRMVYSGPALEAGQKYRLIMHQKSEIPSEIYANFQTVAPEEKARLSLQQKQVRESAWRSGKRGLAMVQEQVSFLTQQGLWLDLAQEILTSTEEITPEWREIQAGIVYETCDKREETVQTDSTGKK